MSLDGPRRDDDLDRLLAASAPPVVPITNELIAELDHVAADAGSQFARERKRPRHLPKLLTGLGLAALLVTGSAGAAVAAAGFSWLPWAENPDVVYRFTLPTGRTCEERVILKRTWYGGDWRGFVADVRQVEVSQAEVDQTLLDIRQPSSAVMLLNADGRLVSPGQAGKTPGDATDDDWHAQAHKLALGYELNRLSQISGLGDNWSSDFQLQCAAVAG